MGYFVIDVESDGPIPSDYSMICFGAVYVDDKLDQSFYGTTKPLPGSSWIKETLAISGISREEHEKFTDPVITMYEFSEWIQTVNKHGRPLFLSDNLAYDWQWINWYFHHFMGSNPFGYSGRRIGDLYCGMVGNLSAPWKHLRKTVHDHNPVNDARGNAEAFNYIKRQLHENQKD